MMKVNVLNTNNQNYMSDKKNEWVFIYWDDWKPDADENEEKPEDNNKGTYSSWL
jgi:hypothetical protein